MAHRKLDCDLKAVLHFLEPHKSQLQSMAVESTFNWYWLLDGLRAAGYPIDLANPAKIEQYNGLKHADDKDDAFHLAELQRLKILPKAHVYDPVLRPAPICCGAAPIWCISARDIIRIQSLYARTTGQRFPLQETKKWNQPKPRSS